ncbi:methyltransferase-like protein 17, mitochondrial isoform X1 [Synchiropus splendidus]|uniref:methyltransferase-like protein 17, mitochondrial isoform X1 n=2 Tax=Synchiropus splendidus TaxID=270530 RepID=UPI00237DC96F|nr:methyltransferase-like protein 17, mitochondrial isoform X1 [Synchiropus splendidus]
MSSRSFRVSLLCHRTSVMRMMQRAMTAEARVQPQADFLKGNQHKRHPGISGMKTLRLPVELQAAACSVIKKANIPQLEEQAHRMKNVLWSRKRAVEESALRKKAVGLEKELWEKAMLKRGDDDEPALEEQIQRRVLSELRRTTYRWTPIKYDEETSVVYMAARLAGGYAAVRRALNEIKKRDPAFAPESLLDFGSGLGSVAWASHSCWPDSLKELVCVDSSGTMNTLAERLLRGDEEEGEPRFKHVYFRQFLPLSPKVQFDLVSAAFTLSELPGMKEREEAAFTLWRKTNRYLVLVESGTREGHQMLLEVRDALLQNQEKTVHDSRPASVFAPCPHELPCPKLALKPPAPCNFQQVHHPLPLTGKPDMQTEKFSYLILTRTAAPVPNGDSDPDWARLISPVQRRTRHVHCRMCCPDGQLRHLVVTARKHSKDMYRCARNSEWGDLVPLVLNPEDNNQNTSQQ